MSLTYFSDRENNERISKKHIVDSYKMYLEVKYPQHYKKFCSLAKNKPESATAEAVVFSLMKSKFRNVKIGEDISSGGADFICVSNKEEFVIEVTSIESKSVANQSGWVHPPPIGKSASGFAMITNMLRTKTSSKAPQLANYPIPRILTITTEHIGADCFLGTCGAEFLLTGDTKITVPMGESIGKVEETTDLRNSVFLGLKTEKSSHAAKAYLQFY